MKKDFFISYNQADQQWAEWIAWQLEESGYTCVIQSWDFQPGANFVQEMGQAIESCERTVAVLSEDYLGSIYARPEWSAAFAQDPTGARKKLVPVRVRKCEPAGLLATIVFINLVGLREEEAKEKLLRQVSGERDKRRPEFPGEMQVPRSVMVKPDFPRPDNPWLKWLAAALVVAIAAFLLYKAKPLALGGPGTTDNTVPASPVFNLASLEASETYQPIPNIAFLKYRQDFGEVDVEDGSGNRRVIWTGEGVARKRAEVDKIFQELRKSGVAAVVWFLFADGAAAPDFDQDGNITGLGRSFEDDYRAAVELAKNHGLSIIWVLIDNQWLKPREVQGDGAALYGHADVIEDARKRKVFFEKALIPMLRLYPAQSPIAGWIIVNEPEVALEQGYVAEKEMGEFISEAVDVIKANTDHQAVSVGHLDLESLIRFREDHPKIDLDFYNFHHYKSYLPPSVDHLGGWLGGGARKPIYIGEFSLNEPAKPRPVLDSRRDEDLRRLVGWSRLLGYAGLWPWALKPVQHGPEQYGEVAAISTLVQEYRQSSGEIDRDAWLQHAQRGMQIVSREIADWQNGLSGHDSEITKNQKNLRESNRLLAEAQDRFLSETATLSTAKGKHQQVSHDLAEGQGRIARMLVTPNYDPAALAADRANEKELQTRLADAQKWVESATLNRANTEKEIAKQKYWQGEYSRIVRLNEYQSDMKKYKIQLARKLYLDYWRAELAKGPSSGN